MNDFSMIDTDVLFTIAEIAVALAGFSAIVGVLSARKGEVSLKVNALRLQVMLETCFVVLAAALLPVLLEKFGLDSTVIWRASSGAILCVVIPFEFVAQKRTKDMPSMTWTKFNVNTVNWGLSISADLILLAILINMVGTNAEAFFLIVLCLELALAANLFVQFAAETFSALNQDED